MLFRSQKGHAEIYRGAEYMQEFIPVVKIEIAVLSDQVETAAATIIGQPNHLIVKPAPEAGFGKNSPLLPGFLAQLSCFLTIEMPCGCIYHMQGRPNIA